MSNYASIQTANGRVICMIEDYVCPQDDRKNCFHFVSPIPTEQIKKVLAEPVIFFDIIIFAETDSGLIPAFKLEECWIMGRGTYERGMYMRKKTIYEKYEGAGL